MDNESEPAVSVPAEVVPWDRAGHLHRSCAISRLPTEVWHLVLHCGSLGPSPRPAILAFSSVCAHARWLAYDLIAPDVTLFSRQLFMLDVNLKQLAKTKALSPFHVTKALRVLSPLRDFEPIPRIALHTFKAITSLELILRPVSWPQAPFTWIDFGVALSDLSKLSELPGLAHLTIYVFANHDYRGDELDICELHTLRTVASLRTLTLRISGGIDITAQTDIALPRSLRRLRVSVEVLSFINRRSWTSLSSDSSTLHIEDARSRSHLRRANYYDAARQLSASMAAALPGLVTRLRTLCLVDVTLDYTTIRALAALVRLTCLDLHPSGVELTRQEALLLETDTHPAGASVKAHAPVLAAPDTPDPLHHPYWTEVARLIVPLKHVLCRLSQLRVLHLAGGSRMWPSRTEESLSCGAVHHALFQKLAAVMHPTLSIWNFGGAVPGARRIYHHLPSCLLCAHETGLARSSACLSYERALHEEHRLSGPQWTQSDITDKFELLSE